MRYEVVLIGYDLEGYLTQYAPILETNDKHEAFEFMGEVKEKENKEPLSSPVPRTAIMKK